MKASVSFSVFRISLITVLYISAVCSHKCINAKLLNLPAQRQGPAGRSSNLDPLLFQLKYRFLHLI
ncbi:Uncharacterised protein [Mycobacteroides abscessus subsp. abscessus]|nr:Uncharacterised protein [Mycobacteroides abscessus subsp. abscessus]